ncbi:hypothetical protein LXL04_022572 [Taraxacum kok-saghyz]
MDGIGTAATGFGHFTAGVDHGVELRSGKLQRRRHAAEKARIFAGFFAGKNGGIGMALLSVTTTAKVRFLLLVSLNNFNLVFDLLCYFTKFQISTQIDIRLWGLIVNVWFLKVRISPFVATLAANPTFVSGFFAWLMAQSLKVLLHFCFEKKLDLRIMCSSGGMPSSHSALCTALTTSVAICHGVADSLFPVCLGFSLIVMYDAIGVRRHAGMQAEVLNLIVEDLFQGHPISKRKLKELLGHTPSQVVAGALLGILVACFCCQVCFGAI